MVNKSELTEAQKKYIEECDRKIAVLRSEIQSIDKKIFALQLQKQFLLAPETIIFGAPWPKMDYEDDLKDKQEWVRVNPCFGERIIDPNVVVKIKPYEKEERGDRSC